MGARRTHLGAYDASSLHSIHYPRSTFRIICHAHRASRNIYYDDMSVNTEATGTLKETISAFEHALKTAPGSVLKQFLEILQQIEDEASGKPIRPFAKFASIVSEEILDKVDNAITQGMDPRGKGKKRLGGIRLGPWEKRPSEIVADFGESALKSDTFLKSLRDLAKAGATYDDALREIKIASNARRNGEHIPRGTNRKQQWIKTDVLTAQKALNLPTQKQELEVHLGNAVEDLAPLSTRVATPTHSTRQHVSPKPSHQAHAQHSDDEDEDDLPSPELGRGVTVERSYKRKRDSVSPSSDAVFDLGMGLSPSSLGPQSSPFVSAGQNEQHISCQRGAGDSPSQLLENGTYVSAPDVVAWFDGVSDVNSNCECSHMSEGPLDIQVSTEDDSLEIQAPNPAEQEAISSTPAQRTGDKSATALASLLPRQCLHEDAILFLLEALNPDTRAIYVIAPGYAHVGITRPGSRLRGLLPTHEIVFVPVFVHSNHWTLAVVRRTTYEVEIYDPLRTASAFQESRAALHSTLPHLKPAGPEKQWRIQSSEVDYNSGFPDVLFTNLSQSPLQQSNSTDCGVYCCVVAFLLMNKVDILPAIDANMWRFAFHACLSAQNGSPYDTSLSEITMFLQARYTSLPVLRDQASSNLESSSDNPPSQLNQCDSHAKSIFRSYEHAISIKQHTMAECDILLNIIRPGITVIEAKLRLLRGWIRSYDEEVSKLGPAASSLDVPRPNDDQLETLERDRQWMSHVVEGMEDYRTRLNAEVAETLKRSEKLQKDMIRIHSQAASWWTMAEIDSKEVELFRGGHNNNLVRS
jgi:hypothetical protein